MKKYLMIIEDTSTGFSAYSPDLPGCAVTGENLRDVESEMNEAIAFHIESLILAGQPVPDPRSRARYCAVAV